MLQQSSDEAALSGSPKRTPRQKRNQPKRERKPVASTANMRSGKTLILATKLFAQENRLRSWWEVLSTLVFLALTTLGALAPWPMPARIICSVLSGLLMVRVFVIYHDHQHRSILDRSRAAEVLMQIIGLISLAPSSIWKSSHNHHHQHNSKLRGSHIGSYPIMTQERFATVSAGDRRTYLFMRHPMTIALGYLTTFMLGMCVLPFFRKPLKHLDCLVSLCVHGALIYGLYLFGGWAAVLLALVLPQAFACGLGSYLFYAQHNFPGVAHKDAAGWTYETAAMESSSYMDIPQTLHWFTANIGYHHIHHLNAKIPFYNLPKAMREMPELQSPKRTSLNPFEVLRCLRLKVWSTERKCMVGL